MELQHYFAIVWRRWPLLLALPLLVGALSAATALRQPQRYGLTARLMVTQTPLSGTADVSLPDFNSVGSWQASEYLLDDLPQVLTSDLFARDVATLLEQQGYTISPATIAGALQGTVTHRSIDIAVTTDQPEAAVAIARGAAEVLRVNGLRYWDRQPADGSPGLQVVVLNLPEQAGPVGSQRRALVEVALRTFLALAVAVGLAFVLHYLDRTVQNRAQAEALLGVPVVGVIPRERGGARGK